MKDYVLNAPRTDFISANREGLVSLSGYASIQLIGMAIGRDIYSILIKSDKKLAKGGPEYLKTEEAISLR